MEIILAAEHAFHLLPQVSFEVARDRVEQKKATLVAGMVGALLTRPKPEEIQLIGLENRLEPFWHVALAARTVYDRTRTYTVTVTGNDVRTVSVLGQDLPVDPKAKGGPAVVLNAVEHCLQEHHTQRSFDGLTGHKGDFAKHLASAKTEIADLSQFAPPGVLVVAPQVKASALVRQLLGDMLKPPPNAQVILEEVVRVDVMDLNFRPVYAFEFELKGKKSVVEFDAVTGEINGGGKKWSAEVQLLKDVLNNETVFDLTTETLNALVPGSSLALKLVRAAIK